MSSITRTITVTRKGMQHQIQVVEGTSLLPISVIVSDYDILSGSAAVAYNRQPNGTLVNQACTISENTISFTPPEGFYLKGYNKTQVRVTNNNRNLFSFVIDVWCDENITDDADVEEINSQPTLVTQLLSQIGVLTARMDAFTALPEGSTTSDAALNDIRIAFDGETYDTPGDAVRGSDSKLNTSIENTIFSGKANIKNVASVSLFPFEIGTYSTSDGTAADSQNYIRTIEMFPVPDKYYFATNITVYAMYYGESKNFLGYERFLTNEAEQNFNFPESSKWMNIVIGSPTTEGNLDNVNQMTFYICGSEYERGGFSADISANQGAMQSTELNISKDNKIMARMPYTATGTLQLFKNGTQMATVSVGWNDYTAVENADFYDFAILTSSSLNENLKNSVMFGGDSEKAALPFDSSQSVYGGTDGEETTADQSYVVNPTDIYFLVRFPRNRLYTFSTGTTPSAQSYLWSCGILRLPSNYSHCGKKVPISFFTHGTSGWVGTGAVQSQFDRCNFLVNNGIACFDVNGWQGCYGGELPPSNRSNGQNMGNPSGCACAHKAFEYIKKVYNVENKCLVFGNSMGGLLALNYANNYRNDVLGCFLLYPVTDLKGQAWDNPWNANCQENIINFYNFPDNVWEERCTYGYNPANNNYAGIPIFIWHGTSDATVSYQGSVDFASKQNSQGGSVYLRTVNGLGHGNYDAWKNIFETESMGAVNWFITTRSTI